MTDARVERRLAAILAADVVGFSALMERDEEGTYSRVGRLRREVIEPRLSEHQGRLIKTTGDGFLAEFASPIAALRCALAIQSSSSNAPDALRLRIGLNLGDVIIEEGGDVYGEGVNVAARLEALADADGILISDKIHREVEGKVEAAFEDRGEQQVKNITRPIRIYAVRSAGTASTSAAAIPSQLDPSKPLPLPDKPSIAVLPFQNMSGDPEQEYFADGMVEDIITALSRFKSLFVIARNSSFTYKGRPVDIKQVGRELGVRYVLEGSVRKAGGKVRITGQLIDATTGAHLWADKIDGSLEDIFGLQDRVTTSVIGAIAPRLELAEIERSKRKPTESLSAYDYYLRGMSQFYHWNKEGNNEGLVLFLKAIERDRSFAAAHGMAAWCYSRRKAHGWMVDPAKEKIEALRLARRAVEIGGDDAFALCLAGLVDAYVGEQHDMAANLMDRALQLNPNLGTVWTLSGWVHAWRGEPNIAIRQLKMAMRLSPVDPLTYYMQAAMALAHFFAGRYDEAAAWAERSVQEQPNFFPAIRFAAASNALAGRLIEARRIIAHLRELVPDQRISNLREVAPFRRPEDLVRFAEGLRAAGLPE